MATVSSHFSPLRVVSHVVTGKIFLDCVNVGTDLNVFRLFDWLMMRHGVRACGERLLRSVATLHTSAH